LPQIALIYKLRWNIETCLLLAIYCHEESNEKVSIKRVRELRTKIRNEAAMMEKAECVVEEDGFHAKT